MSIDISKVNDGCTQSLITPLKINSNVAIRENIISNGNLITITFRWSYGRSKAEWLTEIKYSSALYLSPTGCRHTSQ